MDKDLYDCNEHIYLESLNARTVEIDAQLEKEQASTVGPQPSDSSRTQQNFDQAKRTYGVTQKDRTAHEAAIAQKIINKERFYQEKKSALVQTAAKQLEVIVFGKEWGRVEQREMFYGPDDVLVQKLKKEKLAVEEKLMQEQQKVREEMNAKLGNPHKLEKLEGKYSNHFNEKSKER